MADSLAQALAAAQAAANAELNMEEYEEDEVVDMEEEEEDESYDDIDAEAQEIARRLGQQLWEDITKAQAAHAAVALSVPPPVQKQSRKEEAVILTMKTILSLLDQDPAARSALETALLPGSGGNVLGILQQSVSANSVVKEICIPLSQTLVSLAKSAALFGGLRHSNIPSFELDKGKRRREEGDENLPTDLRPFKRPFVPTGDLYTQISEAVRVITQGLVPASPQPLDSALVASIRLPLHQVFLFAVTSSARGGHDMHALQEISGLIQVIGVLSGIQIGQPPETLPNQSAYANPAYPWMSQPQSYSPATDIGTAIYPCLVAGCGKTFSRLYSLRAHQRSHSTHRPFRCTICPASFTRNHDLKRHVRLHDKKAWKCGGCQKIFSRRDAIKRHKNGSKTRGPKSGICINAEVLEVDLDEEDGEDLLREERRTKLWNSIAAHGINTPQVSYRDSAVLEEGEIPPAVIANTQAIVLSLQGLLQSHVGSALSTPQGHPMLVVNDPTNGQATLASVIARAQMHSLPAKEAPVSDAAGNVATAPNSSAISSATSVEYTGPQDVTMVPLNTADQGEASIMPSLSLYGLTDEQAKMLELAIASAASAAQAQAEAEAALEEEEEDDSSNEGDSDSTDEQETMSTRS
jgi:hypothetical protein